MNPNPKSISQKELFKKMKFLSFQKCIFLIFISLTIYSCTPENTSNNGDKNLSAKKPGTLVTAPEKKEMLLLTDRPPNLETPLKYFLNDFTPNDVFFVRWHLSNLPSQINPDTFHLRINGTVKKELVLTLTDLKTKFKSYTLNALCVCAGNARSTFNPRVPGAQWTNGGMGNARWTGVKLKDILAMAGTKSNSKFVSFNGLDSPPLPSVPDFVKSLELKHAIDGNVMIAYEMNGQPLPVLNGYPLKLIVPGWYATYWVGMLNEVRVLPDTFKGYWMEKAYLIPKDVANGNEQPDSLAKQLVPINKIDVRSIFVSPEPECVLISGTANELQGLAFDDGTGITKVEISNDNGRTWIATQLDASLGNYAWRRWRYQFKPTKAGLYKFFVKATNANGETQPLHQWNRSGYMKNEIESFVIKVQ